jgi:hypothetical protein
MSDDGDDVYFVAHGVLAANTAADGEAAQAGRNNLYLWRRDPGQSSGQTLFVAALDAVDGELWNPGYAGSPAQVTDSGALFISAHTPLKRTGAQADNDDGASDVYRFDPSTEDWARLSTSSSGRGGNDNAADATVSPEFTLPLPASRSHPSVSADGQKVVFYTAEALSPFDHNQSVDVYLWDEGQVYLISDGRPGSVPFPGGAPNASISPSGADVLINTTNPLAVSDIDTNFDVYDVRVEGGFRPSVHPETCAGESGCRPSPNPPLTPTIPETKRLGDGNPRAVKRCPKGKVRRHSQCVKQHKRHKRANHRGRGQKAGRK